MSRLDDLKVGDAVLVSDALGYHKRIVSKRTATQLTLNDGSRWLNRGRKVGAGSWTREWAEPWNQSRYDSWAKQHKLDNDRNNLRRRLEALRVRELSAEKVASINAALDAIEGNDNG